MPGLEQGIEQNSLFALDAIHFGLDARALHHCFDELVMRLHF
jgi:hypothetical protein